MTFALNDTKIMAATGAQVFETKNKYDSYSSETKANPEAGLVQDGVLIYGDTDADLADMRRLGKKQEFRVRKPLRMIIAIAHHHTEKLQLDFYTGIHLDLYGDMGIRAGFFERRVHQWRVRRALLGIRWDRAMLWHDCRQLGRDGEYGSYKRWAISLVSLKFLSEARLL